MSKLGLTLRHGARIHLLLGLCLMGPALSAQTHSASTPPVDAKALARPCSATPVVAPITNRKGGHKPKHPLPPEPVATCIEVKGQAIEIQEFLQTAAQKWAWRIGENRASDDRWSCVRYFDADELEKFADTKVLIEPIKFTSGKAAMSVRTTEIGDGPVRVQISAHLQGEGKSTDKTWGQPQTVWTLNSKGVLEQELVTILQTGYKPLE